EACPDSQTWATPRKLSSKYFTGLATDEGEAQPRGPLARLAELPGALLSVVAVGARVAVHEVTFQDVIDENRELARGGRDRLRLPDARGQPPIERAEGRLRSAEARGGEGQSACKR